jgi:V/A-type H+-transporting ATPase subunit A
MTNKNGKIIKVSGPLVVASGLQGAKMYEVVRVSEQNLVGEIIELAGDQASIQVYEDTSGIGPGGPVVLTGQTLSVELGPGLLESIYDGVQRPLELIEKESGSAFIARGIEVPGVSRTKKWDFKPLANVGQKVGPGETLGTVQETSLIEHKVMVPPGVSGTLVSINAGNKTVEETIAVVETAEGEKEVCMLQKWPIRQPVRMQRSGCLPSRLSQVVDRSTPCFRLSKEVPDVSLVRSDPEKPSPSRVLPNIAMRK